MIVKCRRIDLQLRAQERGYSTEDVSGCIVAEHGDSIEVDTDSPFYPRKRSRPPLPASGPGTELKALLALIGIHSKPNCSCNARAQQMDEWGPDECHRRVDEIADWLGQEASRRKLPFSRFAAVQMVHLAIRRARKKLRNHRSAGT